MRSDTLLTINGNVRFFGRETDIEKKSFAGMETIPRAQSDISSFLGTLVGISHVKDRSTNGSCSEWVVNGQKDFV